MDASEESVMAMVKVKHEEQEEPKQERSPAAAVTAKDDCSEEESKSTAITFGTASLENTAGASAAAVIVAGAEEGTGKVKEEEMESAGGGEGGGAGVNRRPLMMLARWPSPLFSALEGLPDPVLTRLARGDEPWWSEVSSPAVPPPYKPVRLLSTVDKAVAVVAMVKNIAPDYERVAVSVQMAPSITSIITDLEAMSWDAGLSRERDAYIAAHPRDPTPSKAWPLMKSLRPEVLRLKRKEPLQPPPPPPPPPPMSFAEKLAPIAKPEAFKDIHMVPPGGLYYPMPFPHLQPMDFHQVMQAPAAEYKGDAGNPAIGKECVRIDAGSDELELTMRVGGKNRGLDIFHVTDGASGSGTKRARFSVETYESARAYSANQKNRRGAGAASSEQGNSSIKMQLQLAVAEFNRKFEAGGSSRNPGTVLQLSTGVNTGDDETMTEADGWNQDSGADQELPKKDYENEVVVIDDTDIGDDIITIPESGSTHHTAEFLKLLLAGDDDNQTALNRWFEKHYQFVRMEDAPYILDDEPAGADEHNRR
ncbi:hypothetical protein GUJ93_ZPchr0007g4292 [Zizania palustris]|uniref:Uncharacterized protein n=1 Tax=Zizania palustris TaxID=103762 RepID=A0A8J5TG93_ZIZPA|nr:hypothetical protein GUJ93_ZPchr0007g4292 [Zizania palustris]